MTRPVALITGASSGIGATYADRLARRGHDLVLVARDAARLADLSARLTEETGVSVDVLPADLTAAVDLDAVAARLSADTRISLLINNAGAALPGSFSEQSIDKIEQLIALNTTALVRLSHAVAPRFAAAGAGAIVNIGSVVGLVPEFRQTIYGATKAFVLYFSQGLATEFADKGVYVQAVLPAGTRTEIWQRAGVDPARLPPLMEVGDLVDAALAGFDRREPVTIPPLHDEALWTAMQTARVAMLQQFSNTAPAPRYSTGA